MIHILGTRRPFQIKECVKMWNDKLLNGLQSLTHNELHNETVHSIAEMESALANLLNAEVDVLNNYSDRWTSKEIIDYTKHLEGTLKKVILKEIIMLLLLDEKDHKPSKCCCHKGSKCDCRKKDHCHKDNYCACGKKEHCHKDNQCECSRENHYSGNCKCHHKCHCCKSYKSCCVQHSCSKNICNCFSW